MECTESLLKENVAVHHLEVFALDDEFSILGPLDGGFGTAVDVALELGVFLLVRDDTLRPFDEARRNVHLQAGRHISGIFRVFGPTLIDTGVGFRHVGDTQAARRHPLETAVQVAVQ